MSVNVVLSAAKKVLDDNGIVAPFVNVFEIAENAGITIHYASFPDGSTDVSGFLMADDKSIYLNADNSAERQAYTTAHELGHYFLGHEPDAYGVSKRPNNYEAEIKTDEEKEADLFAANLLMPENMVRYEIKKFPFLKDSIQLLSARFGVSASAMRYRLLNLGITEQV